MDLDILDEEDKRKQEEFYNYEKLALQGDSNAQYKLGWMYEFGDGVEEDEKEAIKWYEKAAIQGNSNAQYSLMLIGYINDVEDENIEAANQKWEQIDTILKSSTK